MPNNNEKDSPRYVDETMEGDKNLRPNPEETKERGTDKPPLTEEEVKSDKADEDEEEDKEGEGTA